MSSGDPSTTHPFTPPSASRTVTEGSGLDKAIQIASETLELNFKAENDDDVIKRRLGVAWIVVRDTIRDAGDPTWLQHFRTESEFASYVKRGSDGEQKLVNLLRRIAERQVPWKDLFINGTFLSSLR
jgi:hypothetical protein